MNINSQTCPECGREVESPDMNEHMKMMHPDGRNLGQTGSVNQDKNASQNLQRNDDSRDANSKTKQEKNEETTVNGTNNSTNDQERG